MGNWELTSALGLGHLKVTLIWPLGVCTPRPPVTLRSRLDPDSTRTRARLDPYPGHTRGPGVTLSYTGLG